MDHYNSSDCNIAQVDACCFATVNWEIPSCTNCSVTITSAINFNWQYKVFIAMSFSIILNTVSFLSNNEMATFLKQTKMKRSWCRSKHMKD